MKQLLNLFSYSCRDSVNAVLGGKEMIYFVPGNWLPRSTLPHFFYLDLIVPSYYKF